MPNNKTRDYEEGAGINHSWYWYYNGIKPKAPVDGETKEPIQSHPEPTDNDISLLAYLQIAPNELRVEYYGQPTDNTSNSHYGHQQLQQQLSVWQDFYFDTMWQEYSQLLKQARIERPRCNTTPPGIIGEETSLRLRVAEHIKTPIRRALRATFSDLDTNGALEQHITVVSIDIGDCAQIIEEFRADLGFIGLGQDPYTRPN